MIRPKAFNIALLPGTLVAQIGHVLGLLVTGATITNTSLLMDDESGEPRTTRDGHPKIPVIGPIIIGLLPLLACATGIYFLTRLLGHTVMTNMRAHVVGPSLPISMAGIWQLLRDQITLVEAMVAATTAANFGSWKTWVFLYLLVCLAVRIAPLRANLRGSLAAIVVLGIAAATITSLFDMADPRVQSGWAVLNLTVATLLLLLLISLVIRGGVGLVQILREPG